MAQKRWSTSRLQAFHEAAQSLKLYRRAEILDNEQGSSLVEDLYVDPLPEDQILNTVVRPHTTFVIGRKGTGKSTIFQRLQSELRKSNFRTSAYLDIKTIYESSQVDQAAVMKLEAMEAAMSREAIARLLLYREFIHAVILEIKSELRKRIESSLWERLKETFSGGYAELFEGLDELLESISEDNFINVAAIRTNQVQESHKKSEENSKGVNIGVTIKKDPDLKIGAEASAKTQINSGVDHNFSEILLRTINVKRLLMALRDALAKLGIKQIYILIDDFSELPEEAMRVVVDVLLAPLNNWSDEFIKFKIAAYPGRIYYGNIDKTKIDEIFLDLFRLYGSTDVSKMEESATDFTRRLVTRRLEHYCKGDFTDFFETDTDETWRLLFFATMANPRILGYILHYLHESHLIHGRSIGPRGIQEAAQRYYDDKIESYFNLGKFLHETFAERSSIFSLKELLEDIVRRARGLRGHESEVMRKIKGRPPTGHFHVLVGYESLLSTLELNFFLTKYYEMTDRDARKVSVFALNYGLCSKFTIAFGRPRGEREFRLYFVERIFDYTSLLRSYMARNQEIACEACGARYSFDNLDALKFYGMRCRECPTGVVKVTNLSKKYAKELEAVNESLLLPPTELGILQTLHTESRALRPAYIAAELDCSYQLVGKRGKILAERGLVERAEGAQGQRFISITPLAEDSYFSDRDELDLNPQE